MFVQKWRYVNNGLFFTSTSPELSTPLARRDVIEHAKQHTRYLWLKTEGPLQAQELMGIGGAAESGKMAPSVNQEINF
jgi:hypothetical protein